MADAKRFSLELREWGKKLTTEQAPLFVRKIALDLLRKVTMKSPVDTGRFRANWMTGIGAADESTINEPTAKRGKRKYKNDAVSRGSRVLGSYRDISQGPVYVSNNLPYASPLENGHSGQAPLGILGISVEEINAALKRKR